MAPRAQDAADVGEYLDRPDQVLHRYGQHRAVEAGVGKRQPGFTVEIVDRHFGQCRIVLHLGPVQAQPRDSGRLQRRWQMRTPTAHQVEQRRRSWVDAAQKFRQWS